MAKTRLWTALELKVEVNTPPVLKYRNYAVNPQIVCMWAYFVSRLAPRTNNEYLPTKS